MIANYSARTESLPLGSVSVKEAFSFDYITIETNTKYALDYVDCYGTLGWEVIKNERTFSLKTQLTFKRDRKIKNKDQLNKIQIRLDECLKQINILEDKKTTTAVGGAIGIGLTGALTFGGGMSLCLLYTSLVAIVGGLSLGLFGFFFAGIGYLFYKKTKEKMTTSMNIVIDTKRDEIADICQEV